MRRSAVNTGEELARPRSEPIGPRLSLLSRAFELAEQFQLRPASTHDQVVGQDLRERRPIPAERTAQSRRELGPPQAPTDGQRRRDGRLERAPTEARLELRAKQTIAYKQHKKTARGQIQFQFLLPH